MKKTLLVLVVLLAFIFGFAQNGLLVQSNEKGLYVMHTVAPKENFYSIGRLYSISPKDIEAFNGINMSSGLSIGQTLMIPLNAGNFSQTDDKGTPVYYEVGDKEGLYRVSTKNNKVLMTNLRKWNKLPNDNISAGQKLIVGFLQATGLPDNVAANNPAPAKPEPVAPKPEVKTTQPQQTQPAVEKKQESVAVAPQRNQEKKPAVSPLIAANGSGYFKPHFEKQAKASIANIDQPATAGIFKTSSGWQDGKYYALIDNVEPGTIIRVTNPSNNKTIFAKVLGEMSGIRQNQGLQVRISNAAASVLEVADSSKFIVRVNY